MEQEARQKKIFRWSLLSAILFCVFLATPVLAADGDRVNPRLANFYLYTPLSDSDARELAKWDVVILQMLAQQNSPEQIKLMRRLNPDIVILAYVASQEFPVSNYLNWDRRSDGLLRRLYNGISDEMWLRDQDGDHVVYWQGNWMLNATDYPSASGYRWTDYLSDFMADNVLSSGLWDGIFYDNVWVDVAWVNGGAIDANRDGGNDAKSSLNTAWSVGMSKLFQLTREKAGRQIYIIGNGDKGYYGDINGIYFENYTTNPYLSWEDKMRLYRDSIGKSVQPTFAILGNTSPGASPKTDFQRVRYGLASALLENGYYAYDAGSASHAERWWYDEYDVNLGEPTGGVVSLGNQTTYVKDVWRRDYEHGLALVNSTAETKEVDLGGEFEKLIGHQDATTNNGGIVSQVTLAAKDGLLMLKTFQLAKNLFFINGNFVRFVDWLGQRVRNGFFAYDEKQSGGARLYYGDVDGDGAEEKIIADAFKFFIYNSRGDLWFSDYPFGGNFSGDIRVSVGRLFNQEQDQILIAPSRGGRVIMYNYHGATMQAGFYPLGEKYVGGFSVAIAHLEGKDNFGQAIIGAAAYAGRPSEVLIYDNRLAKLKGRFAPYGSTYRGGLFVAAGDVNSDSKEEIVVGAASGGYKIRVFDSTGRRLSEFSPGEFFGSAGAMVGTTDINFDGQADISVTNAQ